MVIGTVALISNFPGLGCMWKASASSRGEFSVPHWFLPRTVGPPA